MKTPTKLGANEIQQQLRQLAGWALQDDAAIVCERKFPDFAAALAFINQVGALAETANHHPDLLLYGWNKVRVTLSTHSAGGLTALDFALAGKINALAVG